MRQIISIMLAAWLCVSVPAVAKPSVRLGNDHKPMQLFEQLTLTDAQRRSLTAIFANSRGVHRRLQDGLLRNHRALQALRPKTKDYQQRLGQLADKRAVLVRKKVLLNGKVREQIAGVLTPKQLAKLRGLRAQKGARGYNHASLR